MKDKKISKIIMHQTNTKIIKDMDLEVRNYLVLLRCTLMVYLTDKDLSR